MATIAATSMQGVGSRPKTRTTLNGTADTFTYRPGRGDILVLHNPTGSTISPVIDGDGATTAEIQGLGVVTTSGGYTVPSGIAAGAEVLIPLDSIAQYLKGVITITSGSGLVGSVLTT
jgi:hypothetical protein